MTIKAKISLRINFQTAARVFYKKIISTEKTFLTFHNWFSFKQERRIILKEKIFQKNISVRNIKT